MCCKGVYFNNSMRAKLDVLPLRHENISYLTWSLSDVGFLNTTVVSLQNIFRNISIFVMVKVRLYTKLRLNVVHRIFLVLRDMYWLLFAKPIHWNVFYLRGISCNFLSVMKPFVLYCAQVLLFVMLRCTGWANAEFFMLPLWHWIIIQLPSDIERNRGEYG